MESLGNTLGLILATVVTLIAVAFGSERSTEIVKVLLRWLAGKADFLRTIAPHGVGSWILSIVPAYFAAFGFDVEILAEFPVFDSMDAELVKILSMVIIWGTSNYLHKQMPKTGT